MKVKKTLKLQKKKGIPYLIEKILLIYLRDFQM